MSTVTGKDGAQAVGEGVVLEIRHAEEAFRGPFAVHPGTTSGG